MSLSSRFNEHSIYTPEITITPTDLTSSASILQRIELDLADLMRDDAEITEGDEAALLRIRELALDIVRKV